MHPITEPIYIWYKDNHRDLPWRSTTDPYLIWVSEIIMHQTRISQGLDYYHRFIAAFPDLLSLSKAPLQDVLGVWQGLGYYRRAVHMHRAAIMVQTDMGGVMPSDYQSLLSLPGIGDYTASLISSVCNDEKRAAIDGNVNRFAARWLDMPIPPQVAEGRKIVRQLAEEIMGEYDPGVMNNALMEFGALQCVPQNPNCCVCPLTGCLALARNRVNLQPLKKPKRPVPTRHFHYLVFLWHDQQKELQCLIRLRKGDDIWAFLHDFPCIETSSSDDFNPNNTQQIEQWCSSSQGYTLSESVKSYKHQLTHRQIDARFHVCHLNNAPESFAEGLISVPVKELGQYAKPRLIDRFVTDYLIDLCFH